MVTQEISIKLTYPKTFKNASEAYTEVKEAMQRILDGNIHLLQKADDDKDMLPVSVEVGYIDHLSQHYKHEAEYQHTEGYLYDDEEPEGQVTLCDDDYEEIAMRLSDNDWLNDTMSDIIRETVFEYAREKLDDSDNNEV